VRHPRGAPRGGRPAGQRATERASGIGLHALARHEDPAAPFDYDVAAALTPALEARLRHDALAAHRALDCLDFSRSDFRVDGAGEVWFLEVALLAELAGQPYPEFLAGVLGRALRRVLGGDRRDGGSGGRRVGGPEG
jgi:D-alanine-D-alanine ligase